MVILVQITDTVGTYSVQSQSRHRLIGCYQMLPGVSADLAWSGLTDGDHNIVYLLFSSLSPPSACVSPSDPTLTVENVAEVMGEVGDWERVAQGDFTLGLYIPHSKLQEIKQQSSSEKEKSRAVGGYWVNTYPVPSWEKLALVLYEEGEERALAMAKRYLPNGMCIS